VGSLLNIYFISQLFPFRSWGLPWEQARLARQSWLTSQSACPMRPRLHALRLDGTV
jgi:hypothetical protein